MLPRCKVSRLSSAVSGAATLKWRAHTCCCHASPAAAARCRRSPLPPQMSMVKRSKQQVEKMLGQVKAAAGWAEANLAVYEKQEAALNAQAAAKKGELEAFREVALQAALGA